MHIRTSSSSCICEPLAIASFDLSAPFVIVPALAPIDCPGPDPIEMLVPAGVMRGGSDTDAFGTGFPASTSSLAVRSEMQSDSGVHCKSTCV